MADGNLCCPASQDDASSPSHIHQAIDEAMTYLDPPPHESLAVDSVAHAYTILQQKAAAADSEQHHVHPRLERMEAILSHDHSTPNDEWILDQADLYRALLLSSFLLLELGYSAEFTKLLQSSVERCLLLLQILANHHHHHTLPSSRHSLLQAVLEEPLIPLNKQERQYTYILQRSKRDDESDDDPRTMTLEEEHVASAMDKRQLAREEQELVKLAMRPIPNNGGVDPDAPPDEARSPSIVNEGPLVRIIKNNNKTTLCHVELHACGVLILTVNAKPCEYFRLTNKTTLCQSRVDSPSSTTTFQITVQTFGSQEMPPTELLLEFQADSLSLGYAWVTSIHKVIAKLKRDANLQTELRLEWGEEYDAMKHKVMTSRVQPYPHWQSRN